MRIETIGEVLELMRQLFDFVIVDCGGYIDENAVAAWERSDHLFYLLDQSIAAARCAWRFVDLFGRLGLSGVEPNFILSRFQPHHPISEDADYAYAGPADIRENSARRKSARAHAVASAGLVAGRAGISAGPGG